MVVQPDLSGEDWVGPSGAGRIKITAVHSSPVHGCGKVARSGTILFGAPFQFINP